MATYVLIPGGWSGGWQWKAVANIMQAAGHEVYRTTLTGLGERVHLASPDVDMNTHIQDILNVFEYERLSDVILVGYSYSGSVITGVAEVIPEKIRHLVYFDAFVPGDGQCLLDLFDSDFGVYFKHIADTYGDGWLLPHDPPDADRSVPHPYKPNLHKFSVQNPQAAALPRTFIACTEISDPPPPILAPLVAFAKQFKSDPRWRYRELAAGHGDFWRTHPQEAADLLLELAQLYEAVA